MAFTHVRAPAGPAVICRGLPCREDTDASGLPATNTVTFVPPPSSAAGRLALDTVNFIHPVVHVSMLAVVASSGHAHLCWVEGIGCLGVVPDVS